MNALIAKAIEKAAAKNAKGFDPSPGVYEIDETLTLHVSGEIRRGEDTEYTPTADIPLKAALALILEKAGVTREAAAGMLVAAMTEALNGEAEKNEAILARVKDVDAAMERVVAAAAALPKKPRKGSLTAKVAIEVI